MTGTSAQDIATIKYVSGLTIALTPLTSVVPRGEALWFWVEVTNITAEPQPLDFWTNVTLPNGHVYPRDGTLVPPISAVIPPLTTRSGGLAHPIPESAPLETYTYNAYVGPSHPSILAADSFQFTVVDPVSGAGRGMEGPSELQSRSERAAGDLFSLLPPEGWALTENTLFPKVGQATGGGPGFSIGIPPGLGSLVITPNPFGGATIVHFEVWRGDEGENGDPAAVPVLLGLYDLRGRLVRTLVSASMKPGAYDVQWDGRDDRGRRLAPGVYFARLQVSGEGVTRKIVLAR